MTLQTAFEAYKSGDFDKAEALLDPLLRRSDCDGETLHLSALTALKRGQNIAASHRITAALQFPTTTHEVYNTQGLIFRANGDKLEAVQSFRKSLSMRIDYRPARANLASILMSMGDPVAAEPELRALVNTDEPSEKEIVALVSVLTELNRTNEALDILKSADISNATLGLARARIYLQRGEAETTLQHAARAYNDPKCAADALRISLQILAMSGTWNGLGPDLIQELTTLHPRIDAIWAISISTIHRMGDAELAEDLFDRSPKGPSSLSARAEVMLLQSKFEAAEEMAISALKLAPGFPPALSQYCLAALGKGEHAQAQQIADLALKSEPNNQLYYAVKATAGRKRGQDYGYYFNYDNFVQSYELPLPDGWDTLESFNADLTEELEALHVFSTAPIDQTLRGGTQTSPNLAHTHSPAIKAFFKAAKGPIASYLKTIGTNKNHPFLRRNHGEFRIRSGWSVSLKPGGHHVNHVHPEGWISSAYYVDVPKTSGHEGAIAFGQPPFEMGLTHEHEIKAKAGMLVLFPSYLWHGTIPFTEGKRRLTLPIDIMPGLPKT